MMAITGGERYSQSQHTNISWRRTEMVYLFKCRKLGLGVWDGNYEYLLDKESITISSRSRTEAPPPATERDVEFEDKAFLRYVALEKRVAASRRRHGWLRIILESARLLDLLTDALLRGHEGSSHQVGVSCAPEKISTWRRCPAKYLYKGYCGEKTWREGEVLRWSDTETENQLMIFGGFGSAEKTGSVSFQEVWYGNPPKSVMAVDRQDAPEISVKDVKPLTWDEAMGEYSKWSTNTTRPPWGDSTAVANIILCHRRERFIKALYFAKSRLGRAPDRWLAGASTEQRNDVQVISELQAELARLKQENESLRGVRETKETELNDPDKKCDNWRRVVGMMELSKEDLRRRTSRENITDKDLAETVGKTVDFLSGLILFKEKDEFTGGVSKKIEELRGVAALQQKNKDMRKSEKTVADQQENETDRAPALGEGSPGHDSGKVVSKSYVQSHLQDFLHPTQQWARTLEEQLELANSKLALMEKKLRGKLAQCRAHVSKATNGETGKASSEDFLCSLAVAEATQVFINNLYFEHGRTDAGAQDRFGKTVVRLLRGMYVLTHEQYVQLFDWMHGALEGKANPTNITKYTMDAFKWYCKKTWKGLPLHLRVGGSSEGVAVTKLPEAQVPKLPFSGLASNEEMKPCSSHAQLALDCPKTPLDTLQKLFDGFFGLFPLSRPGQRKSVFDELWKMTVSTFLRCPHQRFSFSEQIWSSFNSQYHKHVDSSINAGQKCVQIIPPVLAAPQDFVIPTSSGNALSDDLGWVQVTTGHVDALAP